jgi:uncharacterized protein (TIGR04255 family)
MSLIRVAEARGSFAHAPLALVACQINFEPMLRLSDPAFVAPFQETLRADYPTVNRVAGLQLTLGEGGLRAEPGEGSAAWAFVSADGTWQVSLGQSALTIQSKEHGSYEVLRDRFLSVLRAFLETSKPGARLRLGLRYINRFSFEDATSVENWRTLVRSELLGIAAATELVHADKVMHSFGQARLAQEESQMVVRYGFLEPGTMTHPEVTPPEGPHFLLDMDQFDARRVEEIDVEGVRAELDGFHEDIHGLFRWALTDEAADRLGLDKSAAVEVEA